MTSILDDWDSRCVNVLRELGGQVAEIKSRARETRRREKEAEWVFERAVGEDGGKGGGKSGGKRGAGEAEGNGDVFETEGGEEMEMDDTFGRSGARTAKRGGGRFTGYGKR